MAEYIVEPKSRADIRRLTRELRETLGFDDQFYFPIVELLDIFCRVFPGFSYEVVEDCELPESVHADTDIRTGHIRIKQTVFDRACDGCGRDRMTIAHELGHFLCFVYVGSNYNERCQMSPLLCAVIRSGKLNALPANFLFRLILLWIEICFLMKLPPSAVCRKKPQNIN